MIMEGKGSFVPICQNHIVFLGYTIVLRATGMSCSGCRMLTDIDLQVVFKKASEAF